MKNVKLKLHTSSGQTIITTMPDTYIPELLNYDLDSLVEIPHGKNSSIYVNMRNIIYIEVSEDQNDIQTVQK